MQPEPALLEKEGHLYLSQENFEEAFRFFKEAADIYKSQGNHKESALCFASAASCWALKSGERAFYNAAKIYEEAAKEAELFFDFEYASLLYKHAAICYERDMEFVNFSECFYHSKECYRKFLTFRLFEPQKVHFIKDNKEIEKRKCSIRHILQWFSLTFSYLIWGHGERPLKTLFFGFFLILISAFIYTQGYLLRDGIIFKPNLFEAFYFSVVTFTTVGYGDITPVGMSKLLVMIELFCGLFVVPLFIVGLSRKYLRV